MKIFAHRSRRLLALSLLIASITRIAGAAEVRVLSAGAVEPGLRAAVSAFEQRSGHTVRLQFATAPMIRSRLDETAKGPAGGTEPAFDIVIAPPAVLARMHRDPSRPAICDERVAIGRVGLGVAVRAGAARPAIETAALFRQSLLEADSLVYNRASTGLYLDELLKRLGIADQTHEKTTRYADGASVMQHLQRGRAREIGLGAVTEILLARDGGIQFVGPLPEELQNFTEYVAQPTCARDDGDAHESIEALLHALATPASQAFFRAAGIESSR
jgi:molybdate transport system substrate-binding protein